MVGRNHVISNTCSVVTAACCLKCLEIQQNPIALTATAVADFIKRFMFDSNVNIYASLVLSVFLFYTGTLLPDIDNEKSLLGRHIHLNVEHRTWTHTVWFVIMWSVIGYKFILVRWLVLGYFLHLFWDSLSVGGICWLYPVTQYKYFGNSGAKIKKGHKIYIYRVGKTSETVLMVVLIITSLLSAGLCVYLSWFT